MFLLFLLEGKKRTLTKHTTPQIKIIERGMVIVLTKKIFKKLGIPGGSFKISLDVY